MVDKADLLVWKDIQTRYQSVTVEVGGKRERDTTEATSSFMFPSGRTLSEVIDSDAATVAADALVDRPHKKSKNGKHERS